jgi:ABC-2 type transport system permease protein
MKMKNNRKSSIINYQFVKKEFLHIFRDTWTIIILLLLPVLMIILFGFGITTEVKNTHIAVFDPSNDVITQKIVNKLATSEYFIFDRYISRIEEAEEALKKGEIGMVVVFSERFYENMMHSGDAQVQLIADATDPNTASTLTNYATALISGYKQELKVYSQSSIPNLPVIIPEVKLLYNPTMKGAYNTVPGVLGMVLMLICAMMTSISIAREKETGTMEVLLVSPLKPLTIILSKTAPYFALSIINFINILLLSTFVLKVPVAGSFGLLFGLSMIYIFLSLALGILISTVASSQLVAMLMSGVILMLPTIFFSGLMFPVENMPLILRGLAQIMPAKWFTSAAKNIMIKGAGIESVATELIILSGMAILLLTVSIKKFKNRL